MNSMIGFGLINLVIGCFSFWGYRCSSDDTTRGQFRVSFIVSVVICVSVAGTEVYKRF